MKKVLFTDKGASPKGPYSQAVLVSGKLLFTAGQGPFEPGSGEVVGDTFQEQTIRAFENIKAIAENAGASLKDVVKLNFYLSDWKYMGEFNELFAQYFPEDPPARVPLKVDIPFGFIMMDAVIAVPDV